MPRSESAAAFARAEHPCCIEDACRDHNCELPLPADRSKIACISGTTYQVRHSMREKLCDCIIIWSPGIKDVLVAAELKTGKVKAQHCIRQLQNGIKVAQEILGNAFQSIQFEPLLIHKGGIRANEIRILRDRRLVFRKKRRLARLVRCGTRLDRAFKL